MGVYIITIINFSVLTKPDYVGSVQELYYLDNYPDWMVCKTMPGGSVFDVGTIFSIPKSDICRTAIRHKIYTLLESSEEWEKVTKKINSSYVNNSSLIDFLGKDVLEKFVLKGANTHHLGMIDKDTGEVYKNDFPPTPSQYVLVQKYKIIKPNRVSYYSNYLWDYSSYYTEDKFVIPLENIVRFGITPASSIYNKYIGLNKLDKKKYMDELNLSTDLVPWMRFQTPKVDFTTKYEPEDRNLSLQEAVYISGNNANNFLNIIRMSLLGSFLVSEFFSELGLFLWDMKWEIARDGDNLVFVDTIDTDSIRITTKISYKDKFYFVNFNKQAMRDYYKIMHSDWYKATKLAKEEAKKSGKSFLYHLENGQKNGIFPETPIVDSSFIEIQTEKFEVLLSYIYKKISSDNAIGKLSLIGLKEIEYYDYNGKLNEYSKLNGF